MIGVFDSGIGGLTVVKEIRKRIPSLDVVYFGDTARVPYGPKSKELITKYAIQDTVFLSTKNVELIIVACNTVSAICLDRLKGIFSVPIIGVIEPGVKKALTCADGKIGIIGTVATVRSGAYQKAIEKLNPAIEVKAKACPLFVPLAEEGLMNSKAAHLVAKHYLTSLIEFKMDTLVLGCTHYPLLSETIGKTVGQGVTLVDSASSVAEEVRRSAVRIKENGITQIYLSDVPPGFSHTGSMFLGEPIGKVRKVMVEDYV